MKIRKANLNDVDKLIELMQKADNRTREWAKNRVNSFISNKKKLILVAEDDGRLVGFVGIKKYEDNEARKFADLNKFIWVVWIAVLPEYRKKKIGSELLKSVDEYARAFDKSEVILDCREKVINFYKINGYDIIGNYVYNNAPRYVMTKQIWN
jgi:ribosomal protein S18 acetylase RimI-like enzyme